MIKSRFTKKSSIFGEKENIIFFALFIFVLTFCLFGGAEPNLNLNLLFMFVSSIFLIFAMTVSNCFATFSNLPFYVKSVVILPIILPLIQILPLPSEIWMNLPGHQLRSDVLRLVDKSTTWQPLSLTPTETAYTAAMGIFFSTFLVACIAISRKQFYYVVLAAVSIAVLGVIIGALQFSGAFPVLNFYANAHTNIIVGFFANKNHMALVLAVTLILTKMFFDDGNYRTSSFAFLLFTLFLTVAVLATNSRAGIALMILALIFTFSSNFRGTSKKIIVIVTIFLVLTFYYISYSPTYDLVYERFSDVDDDGRWDFLLNSTPLLREFFLFGSGYGSFSSVYITRESVDALSPAYTNHLHNDFLQLIIEGGVLGFSALVLLVFSVFKAWRVGRKSAASRDAAWFGLSIIILFAAHSIVDYPLRRPAALIYFGIALACLFRTVLPPDGSQIKRVRPTQIA